MGISKIGLKDVISCEDIVHEFCGKKHILNLFFIGLTVTELNY